jgi:hypothetical protein
MATIADALRERVLEEYRLPDWERRDPIRSLYVSPALMQWLEDKGELHEKKLKEGGRFLGEHVEQMLCDFRCAERPAAGDIRRVRPTGDGVLKMHPLGSRIFGWCPAKGEFVAVTAALKSETRADPKLNHSKRKEVLAFAKAHGLSATILRGETNELF